MPAPQSPRAGRPTHWMTGACAAVWAGSVVLTATASRMHACLDAGLQAVAVGAPLASGLAAHASGGRFSRLLIVAGVAFGAGRMVRLRRAALALDQLVHGVRSGRGTARLGDTIAEALGDTSLRLVRRAPDERTVAAIDGNGRAELVLVHDPVLADEPNLLRAAGQIARLQLENEDLVERLSQSLEQLSESRTRLLEVGDRERRRIERDIHDGAQQGLIALRIGLSLLEERLAAVAPQEAATVERLAGNLDDAIAQMRALAHGIYPALLSQHGLGPALQSAARGSPLATTVDVRQRTRYRGAVETSIYFACLEALQNAAKHASGATAVHITVADDGDVVRFEVCDDGEGFDGQPAGGAGLENIRDRVAGAGGSLTVTSAPGCGTRIVGTLPLEPDPGVTERAEARPGSPRQGR